MKTEVLVESSRQSSSYSEFPQDVLDSNAQLMDGIDITASSQSVDSTLLSNLVTLETATLKEGVEESSTSVEPTPLTFSSQSISECNVSELVSNGSRELSTGSKEVSEAVADRAHQNEKPSPLRRTIATQTDAYDSDDESSDEETSSSSDVDSDSSSVCSSDGSVYSNELSSFAADRCLDDGNSVSQLDADYDNNQPSTPEEEIEKSFPNVKEPAFSDRMGDNLSSRLSSTDCADCICSDDADTKQVPSPVTLLSSERKSPENCASGLVSETGVAEANIAVTDNASQHLTVSPCVSSQLCDSGDYSSASNTTRLYRGSTVAFSASEASPTEQTLISDADHMSSGFKMPDCSPDDVRLTSSDAYQSSCGAYSSPQSNYGGVSSDCSPSSCVQLPHNASQNSLGAITGYSMPTPSPTNSSARSFNMTSPSSYQQLASVSQLDQSCCQMEPVGCQPATSLPTSVASYPRPPMEGYLSSLSSHHQTMTPPMERVNGQCPSDYIQPSYHTGSPGMPQMMGWTSMYMQPQQQQGAVKPMEFVPQIANQGHMMPQNVGRTSCRSSLSSIRDAEKQRRYGTKNCNKTVASRSLVSAAPNAVPNVAVQPGTNMITGYDVYGGPGIAECTGDPRGSEMSPALDYHSLHHRPALGYHGSYVSDHPHASVYQYQQPTAGGYVANVHSNHVHCAAQSVGPSTIAYGYMNRTLMGHGTFDMNLMRH